ncbi:helix-turn-helix domain-containing protein [Massilia varians]|uniref:helix-turn-helix domain-containing protein n=1 Tax=Massilia varians TaxID=457921 RepID=UPI0025558128|nr:helix-turn-helix domain-containing protein [Massilia varians]MDK6076322.1 helix-turn-helix domain-containing protein [Massilia varians]
MTFGDRLKQIRTDKGLTQPQFAQMAGIEQSYLSKLENDKSVPSAEMFTTIVSALEMDAASFLQEVDKEALATTLRHIPAVSQFTAGEVRARVNHTRRWLFGSAAAWILGFAMMLAANDGIFFSNKLYKYSSPGVILPGEAENVFSSWREVLAQQLLAKLITIEEMGKRSAEFVATRDRPVTVEWPDSRGTVYVEPAENGRRRFELVDTRHVEAPGNRILQYLGAIVVLCGFVGLFIEWRLRRMKNQ